MVCFNFSVGEAPGTKSHINEENQTMMKVFGANEEDSTSYDIVFILLHLQDISCFCCLSPLFSLPL